MDKIFDLKFIVPPTLFIIFVFIINPVSIPLLPELLGLSENLDFTLAFFTSTSIILGLGFIFSSITCLLINIRGDPRKKFNCKRIWWDKVDTKEVLEEWERQAKRDDFICDQISKRWDMAYVNFNSCIALISALIAKVCLYNPSDPASGICGIWGILWILLLLIFLRNGLRAYNSVYDLDNDLKNN